MIPFPDVLRVEGCQRHITTGLALSVKKGVQEARAKSELLEIRVDGEKCDMGVFKLVTTQITEEKADEVAFLSIDAETCTTNPLLPRILEVADACAIKALGEDFTGGLEVDYLERCKLETHVAEVHGGKEWVGAGRASILCRLKIRILRALYDELNKIVKNDSADSATTDAESYFLTRREAVRGLPRCQRWRLLNKERLLFPFRRGRYIHINIIVALKRHACYL
jgi:hypothetical protein